MLFSAHLQKLFFQISSPRFDQKTFKAKQTLENDDIAELSILAQQNGVTGFIYKNTKSLTIFPKQTEKKLKATYRDTIFKNLEQLGEVLKLLTLLSDNKVKTILLKGVVASEIIFNDLGVYPSNDIDILVHPADLPLVRELLFVQGYNSVEGIDEKNLLTNHYHLMFHNRQHLLEIHWNLSKRYFDIPPEFWWKDVSTIHWRDRNVLELAPEKYLLYTIFRLYDHCFYPLRFLLLIVGIIESYTHKIDWEFLLLAARKFKMERLTLFTLQLINELFDSQIPEHIVRNKIMGYEPLKKVVISGIFKGIHRKHLRMMLYTLLLDNPMQIGRILLGRLFPPKGELCLRYNLAPDSPWIWLYYLANPILLLWRNE